MLGRSTIAKLLGVALALVPVLSHSQFYLKVPETSPAQLTEPEYPVQITNDEIRTLMIQMSINNYRGRCACPYSTDLIGGICGTESAYYLESAPSQSGQSPGRTTVKCFLRDISSEEVYFWKLKYATPWFHGRGR
jgi:hypothetical protein